jgi:hypothetical protein
MNATTAKRASVGPYWLIAGVVALALVAMLAYLLIIRPLLDGGNRPPQPPSETVPNAPGPDNTITTMPPGPPPETPTRRDTDDEDEGGEE